MKTVGARRKRVVGKVCEKLICPSCSKTQRYVCNAKGQPFALAFTMIFLKLMKIFTENHFSTVLYMYNAVLTIFFENVCKCVHSAKSHSRYFFQRFYTVCFLFIFFKANDTWNIILQIMFLLTKHTKYNTYI